MAERYFDTLEEARTAGYITVNEMRHRRPSREYRVVDTSMEYAYGPCFGYDYALVRVDWDESENLAAENSGFNYFGDNPRTIARTATVGISAYFCQMFRAADVADVLAEHAAMTTRNRAQSEAAYWARVQRRRERGIDA